VEESEEPAASHGEEERWSAGSLFR